MGLYDKSGNFREMTDREAVHTIWKWIGAGIIGVALLSAAIWGIGVATSGPAGRGEQIKKINRADNRTFSQEHFHDLLNDIKAYDQQIGVQQAALDAHTAQDAEHDRLAQVVAGIKNQCISTRQQYDADALKISVGAFRDADMPYSIDQQDPTTDCK